jgi:hypothetical protein
MSLMIVVVLFREVLLHEDRISSAGRDGLDDYIRNKVITIERE